ncbi:MAG: hypothetical protein LQ342_000693 [Letrouitia transgressa]|nr:MAG: hypothetical protein LQ342_000693 [Letrouitia transgressa]
MHDHNWSPNIAPYLLHLLLFLFLTSSSLPSANAVDTESISEQYHDQLRLIPLLDQPTLSDDADVANVEASGRYEPGFAGMDRGIVGRAIQPEGLENNVPGKKNIKQGDTHTWTFPKEALLGNYAPRTKGLPLNLTTQDRKVTDLERDLIDLERRQSEAGDAREVFVTLTTCAQPMPQDSPADFPPQQLKAYISTTSQNRNPNEGSNTDVLTVTGGYGNITLTSIKDDIWISVQAPVSNGFVDGYNYELTASIDAPYAAYIDGSRFNPDINDTDSNSALLASEDVTTDKNTTDEWMKLTPPPFEVFANKPDDPLFLGLQRSFCGLMNYTKINTSEKSIIETGGQPKQRFYLTDLSNNTIYSGVMALAKNENTADAGVVGGGGAVWKAQTFKTKSDGNCQILYNLKFCTDVAYAVPSNKDIDLAAIYDNHTENLWQNFNKSLQQIPCETTDTAKYSLARNCTDCENAYKSWLCAVTIPRCHDFSSDLEYLIPRNINASKFFNGTLVPSDEAEGTLFSAQNKSSAYFSQSRNPLIDQQINPGPYKEMLPCEDLCYGLVQSCPAALDFACPLKGYGLNYSYGSYVKDTEWKCNWPGGTLRSSAHVIKGTPWAITISFLAAMLVYG